MLLVFSTEAMADLGKTIRQRLQCMSLAQPSAKGAAGGTHPDLNLLAAFAERTATPELHDTVIGHLDGCARCREILRTLSQAEGEPAAEQRAEKQPMPIGSAPLGPPLDAATRPEMPSQVILLPEAGQPPGPEVAKPSAVRLAVVEAQSLKQGLAGSGQRQGWRWWNSRWTGFAAGFAAAALVIAIWLYYPWPSGKPTQVAMAPAAAPPATSSDRAVSGDKGPARSEATQTSVSPAPARREARERGKEGSGHKKAQPPATVLQGNVSPAATGVAAREAERASETASAAATSPTQILAEAGAASGTAGVAQPKPSPAAGTAPQVRTEGMETSSSRPAPPSIEGKSLGFTSGARRANSFAKASVGSGVAREWTIGIELQNGKPIGRLEHSSDGGRTWQVVRVDNSASLTVVARNGGSLWVGGEKGVLYHSEDSGINWQPVKVAAGPDGPSLTGTVARITVVGPLRVVVVTDTHDIWSTTDGGRTWKQGD